MRVKRSETEDKLVRATQTSLEVVLTVTLNLDEEMSMVSRSWKVIPPTVLKDGILRLLNEYTDSNLRAPLIQTRKGALIVFKLSDLENTSPPVMNFIAGGNVTSVVFQGTIIRSPSMVTHELSC